MASYWEQLVAEHGLEGAREIARSYTRRRKTSGFAAMSLEQRKKLSQKGVDAKRAKKAAEQTARPN